MGMLPHPPCPKTHPIHRTIAKLQDSEDTTCALIAEEWPTFLYDEQAGWSSRDIRNGLFRGHVLARVCSTQFVIPIAWLTS